MATNTPPPPWNKDAAALLKQFLTSRVGRVFIATVEDLRPSFCSSEGDVNAVALQAKFIAGYEKAVSYILKLADPEEILVDVPGSLGAYPDLEDETAWPKEPGLDYTPASVPEAPLVSVKK